MKKIVLAMLAMSLQTFALAETLHPQEMNSCQRTNKLDLTTDIVGRFENGANRVVIERDGVVEITTGLLRSKTADSSYCIKQSATQRGEIKMEFKSSESLARYHIVNKIQFSLNSQDQLVVKSCVTLKNKFIAGLIEVHKNGQTTSGTVPCNLVETTLLRVN